MTDSIKSLNISDLESLMVELDQPKYRAKQIYEWIHTHNADSYDDMTNLPKSLRSSLSDLYPLKSLTIKDRHISGDGTIKYLIALSDGNLTESVAIFDDSESENKSRVTGCISSQAGCPLKCEFCATGHQGFIRNLTSDEIVSQISLISNDISRRIDNVVLMGQGEPFLNYKEVIKAIRRMNQDKGINIGARHITVSTSGIIDGIYDFSEEPEQFRLAISLHSVNQSTRNKLMPRLSGQPLHSLKNALKYYNDVKGRRITLEYLMLDGINDSYDDLNRLIDFCSDLNIYVNILKFNPIKDSPFKASPDSKINEWISSLNENGIVTSLRKSKGQDIAGACGQLITQTIQD